MLARYAFAGAFLLLLVGVITSSALAVSGLQPSLTFPHLSFTSYAAGPQASILLSKHVDRSASLPVVTPSLVSWADVARVHPGNTVAFHYVVTNPSSRAVPVSLTASLVDALSLGTSGTPSSTSIGRDFLLPPGRSTQSGTLPVPAGLRFGRYYLSLTLFTSDTGGSQSLVDGAVTLQVSR